MQKMLTINPMQAGEEQAVIAVWQAAGLTRPYNNPLEDIRFCLASGHGTVLVGKLDTRIIGSVMVGHDGHRGVLYYVGVDPAFARKGFGADLVKAAENWLQQRGVWKINIMIRVGNEKVVSFYESLGFDISPRVNMEKWLDESRKPA